MMGLIAHQTYTFLGPRILYYYRNFIYTFRNEVPNINKQKKYGYITYQTSRNEAHDQHQTSIRMPSFTKLKTRPKFTC